MKLKELRDILCIEEELRDIDNWVFDKISKGGVGLHSYAISKDQKKYFVKEVKDNEANALLLIYPLKLKHFINVLCPDLLMNNVLVSEFVSGKTLKTKILHPGLLRDFAEMQNRLNDVSYFNGYNSNKYSLCKFSDHDDGFFRNGYLECFDVAYKNIVNLNNRYSLPIVQKFLVLIEFLMEDKERIVDELVTMPFAWQHHDFREDNIVGRRQVLIDWGSSYGYGPFMFDLAPFLLNNRRSLDVYIEVSEICRRASRKRIEKWVYVSAAIRILERLRYQFGELSQINSESVREFLEYEYETYKFLLRGEKQDMLFYRNAGNYNLS